MRIARERVEKALQYAWRDRKTKKRDMRSLWIQRINAASKEHGVIFHSFFIHWRIIHSSSCASIMRDAELLASSIFSARLLFSRPEKVEVLSLQVAYSKLMHGLQQDNIQINRKVLSDLAVQEPFSFKALVDQVKRMRGSA